MKHPFFSILLWLAITGTVLAAPPANDNFANAAVLTGLPATTTMATNREATRQTSEPDETEGSGGASVWWNWTAPTSGWVEINTLDSSFDSVLAVYTGSSLTGLNLVEWNDETEQNSRSRVKFQAISGTVYRIQVQGWLAVSGDITLSALATTAPALPVLQRLTITPATSDVSSANGSLSAEIQFTSPVELRSATLTFTSSNGDTFSSLARANNNLIPVSGTLQAGVYEFTVITPRQRTAGTWQASVSLEDKTGSKAHYAKPSYPALPVGSTTSISLVNTSIADLLPPRITSAAITPNPVNVSSGDQTITVRITASDDGGIKYILVKLTNPNGDTPIFDYLTAQVSGNAQSGIWQQTFTVPQTSALGTWKASYQVFDLSERVVSYDIVLGPLPPAIQGTLRITDGTPDAYTVWRTARPALAGSSGLPEADHDGDGLPNAVEFLLGTDPLLNSRAGGLDPDAARAPIYSLTPTGLRAEYRLSAVNPVLGSGTTLQLQPQSNLALNTSWSLLAPTLISGDLWRVDLPFSGSSRGFLRFSVQP
jgi:hypothetical protein